jgi:hypothetical protein
MFIYLPPCQSDFQIPKTKLLHDQTLITRHCHTRRSSLILLYFFLWRCGPTRAMASFITLLHHTQRRTTVGRTPEDEWSARHTDLWQHTALTRDRHPCPRRDSNPQPQQASNLRPRGNGTGIQPYLTVINYLVWLPFRGRGTQARIQSYLLKTSQTT